MCQDQVVPNFQEIHSPVSIPYPASVLPPTQESRSSGLPGPPNLTTKSIPGVILASPLTPCGAAMPPPTHTHTNESYLVRPIEWDGRRPTAAQMGLPACFPDVRPDTNAPPSGETWRDGQSLWYSDLGPVPPDSHSTTQTVNVGLRNGQVMG